MTGIYAYTNKKPLNRSHGQAWARYTINFVGNTKPHPRLLTVTQHGGSVPNPDHLN